MNRLKLIKWLMVGVSVVMLSACGGGSSGSSAPVAPTPEEIQAEAIETINSYDGSGEAPSVPVYEAAGITDVNEGNIDSINEAIAGDDNTDTQDDIQDIADEAGSIYENAEDGLTNGWSTYSGTGTITNVVDDDKVAFDDKGSRVIKLSGNGVDSGYLFGDDWNNSRGKNMSWSMKYDEYFVIYISLHTSKGSRSIAYRPLEPENETGLDKQKLYINMGIGSEANDGTWQSFTRDLEKDLKKYEPDNEIVSVNHFLIRGSGIIDDIEFR